MEDALKTVNELLVEVFNRILLIEEKQLKKNGVTISMTEMHLLENIAKSKTKTMSDVAKLQGVTLGTLSVGVKSLVRKGYITQVRNEKDKRIFHLELTDKAISNLEIHKRFHDKMVKNAVLDLDLNAQKDLVYGLQQISNYFNQVQLEDEI